MDRETAMLSCTRAWKHIGGASFWGCLRDFVVGLDVEGHKFVANSWPKTAEKTKFGWKLRFSQCFYFWHSFWMTLYVCMYDAYIYVPPSLTLILKRASMYDADAQTSRFSELDCATFSNAQKVRNCVCYVLISRFLLPDFRPRCGGLIIWREKK